MMGGMPNFKAWIFIVSGCSSETKTSTPLANFAVLASGRPSPVQTKERPFQSEAIGRSAVFPVRPTPMTNNDAVLVVADAVVVLIVELVDFHLITVADRKLIEAVGVPVGHRLHALDHGHGAILGSATRGTGDAQRLPAPHPGREAVDVWEFAIVIDVQMGDEDVVHSLERHL